MRRLRILWRNARPNRIGPGRIAFVALSEDGTPRHRSWIPFSAAQLIGGRYWSLSVIRRKPVAGYGPGAGPIDRAVVESALDALNSTEPDASEAAARLRAALGPRM